MEWTWSWIRPDGSRGFGWPCASRAEAEAQADSWMPIVSRPIGAPEWLT